MPEPGEGKEAVFDFDDIKSRIKGDPMIKKKEPEISPVAYACLLCSDSGWIPSPLKTGRWRLCPNCLNPLHNELPDYPAPTI